MQRPVLRRVGLFTGMLFLTLAFVACAGFGKRMKPPEVGLVSIRVLEVALLEASFEVILRVINTNEVPIKTKGVEFKIELNGQRFATGVSNTAIEVPPLGTDTVPVTVFSNVLNILQSAQTLPGKEQIAYRIKGKLHIGGKGFSAPLPFSSEGELSVKGLQNLN